jgi:low density lipoprotein receptor-related protein 5/6
VTYSYGLAVDPIGRKLFWTESVAKRIRRASLDGSNIEDLITSGLLGSGAFALDLYSGKMYWADDDKLRRADINGSNILTSKWY